jgi:hypothetical protein
VGGVCVLIDIDDPKTTGASWNKSGTGTCKRQVAGGGAHAAQRHWLITCVAALPVQSVTTRYVHGPYKTNCKTHAQPRELVNWVNGRLLAAERMQLRGTG